MDMFELFCNVWFGVLALVVITMPIWIGIDAYRIYQRGRQLAALREDLDRQRNAVWASYQNRRT